MIFCWRKKKNRITNCFTGDVQIRDEYPRFSQRFYEENGIKLVKYPEYDAILKNGVVNFISISYYMSFCETTQNYQAIVSGNMMGGVRNKYLKTNEWDWQTIYTSIHLNGQPREVDGLPSKNEGIHDFSDKQKCKNTESINNLKFLKSTGPDLLSYTNQIKNIWIWKKSVQTR